MLGLLASGCSPWFWTMLGHEDTCLIHKFSLCIFLLELGTKRRVNREKWRGQRSKKIIIGITLLDRHKSKIDTVNVVAIRACSYIWRGHPMWMQVLILAVPCLIQLPTNLPEKALEKSPTPWVTAVLVRYLNEAPGSWLQLAQSWALWSFGEEASRCKISLCLFLCVILHFK